MGETERRGTNVDGNGLPVLDDPGGRLTDLGLGMAVAPDAFVDARFDEINARAELAPDSHGAARCALKGSRSDKRVKITPDGHFRNAQMSGQIGDGDITALRDQQRDTVLTVGRRHAARGPPRHVWALFSILLRLNHLGK